MVVSLPIHRGERPRTPLESAPTAFSQLCTAVSQHGWLTRERLSRLLGTLNPPAPLAPRGLQGRLVHAHLPRGVLRVLLLSGPSRIRSPWARRGVQAVAQPPKVRDRVSLDYGVHRLTSVCWECPTGNRSPDSRAAPRSVSRGDADGGEEGPPRVSPFDGSESLGRADSGAVGLLFARGYQAVHRFSRAALKMGETGAGSFGDVDALKYYVYELPDGSIIYADKAYNDYEIEDLLKEEDHIQLIPMRKKNSKSALQ